MSKNGLKVLNSQEKSKAWNLVLILKTKNVINKNKNKNRPLNQHRIKNPHIIEKEIQ